MNCFSKYLAAGLALLGAFSPAPASLVERDLYLPGDALVTLDTNTGLEWLDLKLTTGLSYNDVVAGTGGWIEAGWRYALGDEICELFQTYAFFDSPCPSDIGAFTDGDSVTALIALLGETDPIPPSARTYGLFDDGNPTPTVGIAELTYNSFFDRSEWGVVEDDVGASFNDLTVGSWMVRLPNPTSIDRSPTVVEPPLTLAQNAPNPVGAETTIRFGLRQATRVSLTVYDAAGRRVVDLVAPRRFSSGAFAVTWDGRDRRGVKVPPGVYFYRLETEHATKSRKMLVTE